MSEMIDFNTIVRDGTFQIELSNRAISGNRAMLNRFEICFLTALRTYKNKGVYYVDNFGGNAFNYISKPYVLSDTSTISTALSVSIEKTVQSLQDDERDSMPDTERIKSASLTDLFKDQDSVLNAKINVVPVEVEPYADLQFILPITKREF